MGVVINLKRLIEGGITLEGALTPEELDIPHDDECVDVREPLHYRFDVELMDDGILVEGGVDFILDCECVRCLTPFKLNKKLNFKDYFALKGEDAIPIKEDRIDLTPSLREDILLAYPQHPLCDEGCDRLPNVPAQDKKLKMGTDAESSNSSAAWGELDKLKLD